MDSIQVNSLPLHEVISDIADSFKTSYSSNCDQFHLTIPNNIGKGFIKAINFKGGLGILLYNCIFYKDLEIQFIINDIHPLKFLYCLEGNIHHRFGNDKELHVLNQYQSSVVASQDNIGHILQFKANTHTSIGSLEIDRKKFQSKMDCELKNLNTNLQNLFKDEHAKAAFYYEGFYSLQIADQFREIDEFKDNDFINKLFLEGKAYQILTQQILQYTDDQKEAGNRSLLRKSEINLIEKSARIIENEISDFHTIDHLATRIGLNVNKLQHGFKYLYNTTVNGYLQNTRLELAKNLLINTDYNISEIVQKVGLSSKSYFSKIFREQYDITPSAFRQKNRATIKNK